MEPRCLASCIAMKRREEISFGLASHRHLIYRTLHSGVVTLNHALFEIRDPPVQFDHDAGLPVGKPLLCCSHSVCHNQSNLFEIRLSHPKAILHQMPQRSAAACDNSPFP